MSVKSSTELIKVITKLPNSEQSYKGKVKTHNYINRQNIMFVKTPTLNKTFILYTLYFIYMSETWYG